MEFFGLLFFAIIIEGIVSYVKTFFVDGKIQWQTMVAIALGIVVALAYQVDLLATVGLTAMVPYVGCVLTGILISRGSNYIFDLIKLVGELIAKTKASIPNE